MVLLCISLIQIGKQSPLSSLAHGFFATNRDENTESDIEQLSQHNKRFTCAIITQLFLSLTYMAACIAISFHFSTATSFHLFFASSIAHYGSWVALLVGMILLLVYEEKKKNDLREQYDTDGKMMSIFFTTRLGMWSPR